MSDGSTKAQCRHCFHFLVAGFNSTLKNHITQKYCEALKSVPEAGQSSMARDGSLFVYNPDVVHEQSAGLMIQEGLPFNHFDNSRMTRVFQYLPQRKYNHESQFPVLSRMAQDIQSVQATSLASESDFSTSERVLSIRRTRLTPASLEMYMCPKDHLDATDQIQHTSNLKNSLDFEEAILDEEVLANETLLLYDEEITLDEAAFEARSNGSGDEIEITSD
ncbi:zinc finger BED domain-containing protein RICESLEEPER 2 [Tanacetum coccineum]